MNNSAVPPLTATPSAATTTTVQPPTGVEQGRQDRSAAIAVGMPMRRLLLRQPRRAPCQQQCDHVGKIVNGVRNQRQRIGSVAEDQLGNHEGRVERGADGERPAEIVRRVAVAGVTMGMIIPVGMIVMRVIVRHSASMIFDGDLYSARNFEYYYRRESQGRQSDLSAVARRAKAEACPPFSMNMPIDG